MRAIQPWTRLHERVLSSKIPTEMIFDTLTTTRVRMILTSAARRIIGNPRMFLKKPEEEQKRLVQKFAKSVVKPLHDLPHFLYNRLDFEAHPIGPGQNLFGTGYQHTYWTIIVIAVNETVSPAALVDAMLNDFEREIIRLRSVVRHEFTHRLGMEKINLNPLKRIQSKSFQNIVTASVGHHEYYGKPTEILAHANHTIELMIHGDDQGWREVLANYVLTDNSPNHISTKEYIQDLTKLLKEYKIPLTKRLVFRRLLYKLVERMQGKLRELNGETPLERRNILAQVISDPGVKEPLDGIKFVVDRENGQGGPLYREKSSHIFPRTRTVTT